MGLIPQNNVHYPDSVYNNIANNHDIVKKVC